MHGPLNVKKKKYVLFLLESQNHCQFPLLTDSNEETDFLE